ncbi:unnamed protein product, partial [marine sediment metagenome]
FTPEEYSSMGYMQNQDYDPSMFTEGSYSSFKSLDINFFNLPVYRADTKEEFVTDLFFLTGSFITGGSTGGLRFALGKLESD